MIKLISKDAKKYVIVSVLTPNGSHPLVIFLNMFEEKNGLNTVDLKRELL